MASKQQVTPSTLPTTRNTMISKSISIKSTPLSLDDLYNISPLLKRMRNGRSSKITHSMSESSIQLMNTRLSFNQLKNNEQKFHRKKRQSLKSKRRKKHQFNSVAYCVAYCTIIILGTSIGGWTGGLFEFIVNGHNGCNNEYRGNRKCVAKYKSVNVTVHCMNIFYKKYILNESPYICLCRFRNQSKVKYRDCEFLYAKIQ